MTSTADKLLVGGGADGADAANGADTDFELVASSSPSGASSVEFTSISSTYKRLMLVWENVTPATDNVTLRLRISTDNGSTWDNGASDYAYACISVEGSSSKDGGDASANHIVLSKNAIGNASNEQSCGYCEIYNPSNSKYTYLTALSVSFSNLGAGSFSSLGGGRLASSVVDAIQISMSSGNLSGEFRLYGVKE